MANPDNQALLDEACKKIGSVGDELPDALLKRVYRYFVERYWTWGALVKAAEKISDDRVPLLVEALKSGRVTEASFLMAAHEEAGADGLRNASAYLSMIHRTTHISGLLASLNKNWAKLVEPKTLAKAASVAVGKHLVEKPLSDVRQFFGLVFLVARVSPKDPILERVKVTNAKWGDEYDTLGRTLAAATKKKGSS